jgi:hypothetical protein
MKTPLAHILQLLAQMDVSFTSTLDFGRYSGEFPKEFRLASQAIF